MPRGTSVALYGLSANPPTGAGGHATIVAHLRRTFDEVWVLPVYRHIFATKANNLAPYERRKRMCELAFGAEASPIQDNAAAADDGGSGGGGSGSGAGGGRVLVLDVERAVVTAAHERARVEGTPADAVKVGSWDVLAALQGANPGVEFTWLGGGGTAAECS